MFRRGRPQGWSGAQSFVLLVLLVSSFFVAFAPSPVGTASGGGSFTLAGDGSHLRPRELRVPAVRTSNALSGEGVNIYSLISSPPAPTGLTDYGVLNSSGQITRYEEEVSQITGDAVISQIAAYNKTGVPGSSPDGAGLQLNAVLRVNTTQGQYYYFLQNTLTLFTRVGVADFVDNVWNFTSGTALLNQSRMSGRGLVIPSGPPLSTTFYGYVTGSFTYATPENLKMTVAVSHTSNETTVAFGYRKSSRGIGIPGRMTFYDNATISEPGTILQAAMIVSGNDTAPNGNFMDAEFVFTGDCCGASTTLRSMDSTLNLSYVLADGLATRPRAVYEFGSNTAEAVYNLGVNRVSSGFHVGLGSIDFGKSFAAATSSVVLACSPPGVAVGLPVKCTATVSGANPSGSVTFSSTGGGSFSAVGGRSKGAALNCTLAKGSCSVRYIASSAGPSANITASYPGDASNLGSHTVFRISVAKHVSRVSVSCKPAKPRSGSIVACTATVAGYKPTGTVQWIQVGGTSSVILASTMCTLVKGACTVKLTGSTGGTAVVQALYGGDSNNSGGTGTRNLQII